MNAQGDVVGGRYRLDAVVGTGGMATVWRAHDQVTASDVAVKRMHSRVQDDPDLIERFRREAQAASRLSHPSIVRLLDEGQDDEGPYIVFELVEGTNLKQLIRAKGAMDPAAAASIAGQVARGLELAHRSGVIHRDIKSHNVLVTDDGVAKLTDFGIARLLDGDDGGLTRTGTVLGTSDYLAPEQARGLGADGRSDVYALGIVLYECLTGELPFPADTPMGVAQRQVRDPMPDPRAARPEVPAYLAMVVLRACEKDPSARFLTALDMSDALLDAPEGATGVMPVVDAPTGDVADAVPAVAAVGDDDVTGPLAVTPGPGQAPDADASDDATGVRPVVADADTAIPELATAAAAAAVAAAATDVDEPRLPPRPQVEEGGVVAPNEPLPPGVGEPETAPVVHRAGRGGGKGGGKASAGDDAGGTGRKWAGLVAGLLVLALVGVGGFIVWQGRGTTPAATPSKATPAASADSGAGGAAPTGASDADATLALASVVDVDPGGDGREMPGEVPLAYDGNEQTAWRTEKYATPDFGGVGKKGVGLQFTLQQPAVATRMDLITKGTGGTFQVLAGPPGASARVVGTGTFENGKQSVDLTPGAASDVYTLWITEPPPNIEGSGYRAYVAEASLVGRP